MNKLEEIKNKNKEGKVNCVVWHNTAFPGLVAESLVSANSWLRGIKTYRFPWYLTLVSANHASSNPGLEPVKKST